MKFSEYLTGKTGPYLDEQLKKPFLMGISDGSLPEDIFKYWIKVDFPYLVNYAKLLAFSINKADTIKDLELLNRLLKGAIGEMELHKKYAELYGISSSDLENAVLGPTKYSYTRHEVSVAYNGTYGELLAAMLPCDWNYGIIANLLIKNNPISKNNSYADWLETYSSDKFKQIGIDFCRLIDEVADRCTQNELSRMEKLFFISMYYEVKCWDAYYNQESWNL